MKKTEAAGTWDSALIKDLAYIRRHLRYPISKTRVILSVAGALLIGFVFRSAFIAMELSGTKRSFIFYFIETGIVVIPALIMIPRLVGQIRFGCVYTGLSFPDNQVLLEQFLKSRNMVILRNNAAPGVYQILSKNISAVGEQREVMVFIADDQRILMNSHFTSEGSKYNLSFAKRHNRVMAKMLRKWVASRQSFTHITSRP